MRTSKSFMYPKVIIMKEIERIKSRDNSNPLVPLLYATMYKKVNHK